MQQQIQFCRTLDGVRIAYTTTGSGPPLVRVANWLTHLEFDRESPVWSHWFEALSDGHTLVRYDARGTGLSDRSADRFSLDTWVCDLEAVVDALKLEQFSLLGFCQGGAVATTYAVRHSERVDRLILYDSYLRGAFVDDASTETRREAGALGEMIKVGWGQDVGAFRQVFANLLIPGASTEQQQWYTELQQRTVSPDIAARLWRAFHMLDIRDLAPRVRIPTLVFHVRGDAMVPFEHGRQLAACIPEARFVPLSGQNHILLKDEPAWTRFLAEVRTFLATRTPESCSDQCQRVVFPELTPREREVLNLLAQGLDNATIAERLAIAPKTVRNHITRVYRKLGVNSRTQAAVLAREAGLGVSSD
jgi:pimeloyl-ACP methyl ester carboxylesterase/DNA-binding CsgD family transcriptional regulator